MPRQLTASSLGGLPIQLDPNLGDYASFLEGLLQLVRELTPEWTDFYPSDPGVTLLEAVAYAADVLSYKADRVWNESYLLTAQQRSSVVDILRLIQYELSPGSAAQVPIVVQTDQSTSLPVLWTISSAASVLSPALSFELLNPVSLTGPGYWTTDALAPIVAQSVGAGNVFVNNDLILVHGETVLGEAVGTSSGEPNQAFFLSRTPLALNPDGTSPLIVRVNGVVWDAVTNFLDAEPTDEVYQWRIEANGSVRIRFSDGVSGKIPPGGESITADYRVGGGEVGNSVGVGSLNSPDVAVTGVVQVFNPVQPSAGSAAETLEHAKRFGPLSLRALDRCVTLEDYETLAVRVPGGGIAAARAAHGDTPFEVKIYIVAEGANPIPPGKWYPSLDTGTGVVGAVGRWLTEKKTAPTRIQVLTPTVVRPRIEGTVFALPNVLRGDVAYEVERNIVTFLRSTAEQFGLPVPRSRIVQIIENTRGVDSVNLLAFHRLPALRFLLGSEAAFTSSASVFSGLSPATVYDRYTIQWLNGATYRVTGARYGPIVDVDGRRLSFSTGVANQINHYPVNAPDTVAPRSPQFSLNIVTGAPLPQPGDRWEFAVDSYAGNLVLSPYEVVVPTLTVDGLMIPSELGLLYGGGIG